MLTSWLETAVRTDTTLPFQVLDVRELPVERSLLVQTLAKELLVAHKDPAHLQRVAARAGLPRVRQYLASEVFPTRRNVRIGDFGEVLGAAILRERDGLYLPIFKLRYREKRDWPMRLTDLLALQRDHAHGFTAIRFGEVKTRTAADVQAACKGHESLASELATERPEIIAFVINRLFDQGRLEEADALEELLASGGSGIPRHHDVILLFERAAWNEEGLRRLAALPLRLPNLRVQVILIDRLSPLVDECYRHVTEILQ